MKYKYYQVDAFTNEPFKGNPAGVIFANIENEELMQKIAFENNLSETAFISQRNNE
ncbi:PhzF family phenazine biosynthesis protein, partial [Gammaproteobacteria bacterium]|nr:PhzF family phenazine biosynthesis protein [Gammaproteobacteria bacterium]